MVHRLLLAVTGGVVLISSAVYTNIAVAVTIDPYVIPLNGRFEGGVVKRETATVGGEREEYLGAVDGEDDNGNPIRVLGSGGCFSLADLKGSSPADRRENLTLPGWTRTGGVVEVYKTGLSTYNGQDSSFIYLGQDTANDEVYLPGASVGSTGVHFYSKQDADAKMLSNGFTVDASVEGTYGVSFDLYREEGTVVDRNAGAKNATLTVTLITTDGNGVRTRSVLLSDNLDALGIVAKKTDTTVNVVTLYHDSVALQDNYTYQLEFSLSSSSGAGRVSMSNLQVMQSVPQSDDPGKIPEPATWAMLAGVAAVGGCWYRRKGRKALNRR